MQVETLQPGGTTAKLCAGLTVLASQIDVHTSRMAPLGIGRDTVG